MYDPELGRFISRDPAGYVDGMNLYASYFAVNGMDAYGLEVYLKYQTIADTRIVTHTDIITTRGDKVTKLSPRTNQKTGNMDLVKDSSNMKSANKNVNKGNLDDLLNGKENIVQIKKPDSFQGTEEEWAARVEEVAQRYQDDIKFNLLPDEGETNCQSLLGTILEEAGSDWDPYNGSGLAIVFWKHRVKIANKNKCK